MPLLRKLGRCGPQVGAIGLGTFSFSHAYGHADSTESLRTLDKALELGCTFLDTADSYGAGENERWLGRALEGRRDAVILGTKVGFVWDQGRQGDRTRRPAGDSSSRHRRQPPAPAHRCPRSLHPPSRRPGSPCRRKRRRDGQRSRRRQSSPCSASPRSSLRSCCEHIESTPSPRFNRSSRFGHEGPSTS